METPRQIISLSHPLVKHLVKLRQNKNYRHEHQSVVVEGIKPVTEILSHLTPKLILTHDSNLIPQGIKGGEIILVTKAIMSKISGMVASEGLLAEVPLPVESSLKGMSHIIALDSINDPGNMGTLLRSALALGWQGAFILGSSCDPFNEKAIRSARGACFRLPLRYGSWEELKALIDQNQWLPLVADLEGAPPDVFSAKNKVLLVLGNEAQGPSSEAFEICKRVTIPITEKMESLNVATAGGILMYLLKNSH